MSYVQLLQGFSPVFAKPNIIFSKNIDPKNQIISFLFWRSTEPDFFVVLPVDQKINFVSP